MDCQTVREHLHELNRGRLSAEVEREVRAHLAQCAGCAEALRDEIEIRRLVQSQAVRQAAPPALRARIRRLLDESQTKRGPLGAAWAALYRRPLVAVSVAVALVVLGWIGTLWMAVDPISPLARRAVAEHTEYARDAMHEPAADVSALLGRLQGKVGFSIEPVFTGDPDTRLIDAKTEELFGRKAVALVYRDASGRYTSLFLMPETGIAIPDESRLQIERFKPYHRVTEGRQLLLWKQRKLAYLLVSDLPEADAAQMFLKVRKVA